MRMMHLINFKRHIPFINLATLFYTANSYADAFKCVDNKGNTIFQDSECGDHKKETKIAIKKMAVGSQCSSLCDSANTLCIADMGLGNNNTSQGLLLCDNAKSACHIRCVNPSKGRELEAFNAMQQSTYEREIRNQQYQKEFKQHQAFRKKNKAEWERKRKQRHCHRYEKKLAKIRARWVNKQRYGWTPRDEEYYRRKIENAEDEVTIECQ
jgi:hypothetical protein